jgi:hypothetical protein
MPEGTEHDRLNLVSMSISGLSVDALDAVLAGGSFSVGSEDELLARFLSLGAEYDPLLRRIELRFLSATGAAEWAWRDIAGACRTRLPGGSVSPAGLWRQTTK